MKTLLSHPRNFFGLLSLFFVLSTIPAQAQEGAKIKLESLDRLAARASEVVNKEETTPDGGGMVYVRSFEFKQTGQYGESEVEEIRAQLRAPGWSRFMRVEDKDDPEGRETVEIYVFGKSKESDIYAGMTIIVTEPKELTVVNIVGQGNVNQLMKQVKKNEAPD
ncbi:MAG: DUF4252 domain-containing protein [Acidobacteria bacterium]|jgi:hypothetical protein|nr:DUF4252 domain-containing protein [Acidobacteriota bacterium]